MSKELVGILILAGGALFVGAAGLFLAISLWDVVKELRRDASYLAERVTRNEGRR